MLRARNSARAFSALAKDWLLRIAAAEIIPISPQEAARVVKLSKNNLRACLQALELHGAERRLLAPSGLPEVAPVKNLAQTAGNMVAVVP
jgi:hypothetical protein